MKQAIKNLATVFTGLALIAGASGCNNQQIRSLEQNLDSTSNRLAVAICERDNYRRELIRHGNPEGWVLNGDGIGSCWYERYEGDGLGGCWKEYLPYKE